MIKAGGEITHQMAEWNVLESFTCAMEEAGVPGRNWGTWVHCVLLDFSKMSIQ